jgi:choline dehydrogenase-like flavoprotein
MTHRVLAVKPGALESGSTEHGVKNGHGIETRSSGRVENLRVADGSIMRRITTANTMAPCVVIGERAAELLTSEHRQ